jgi:hypothetical protein
VKRLLQEKPVINQLCIDFKSTALLWAVHGYKLGGAGNRHHQVECLRLLIEAGFDKTIPNLDGTLPVGFLEEKDVEMLQLLN